MRFHRIQNPSEIDEKRIDALIEAGAETVILQFSAAEAYDDGLLDSINHVCERFGSKLNVRFYGHYRSELDCLNLRRLPAVRSLDIDCLQNAAHIDALEDLEHLEEFTFDIFEANLPNLLEMRSLQKVRKLTLIGNRRRNIDLRPLVSFVHLDELFLNGHARGIDTLATLPKLRKLSFSAIGKGVDLRFVGEIEQLASLTYILGGRESLNDLAHPRLQELEILRVLGLSECNLALFPSLERLRIEDQIRLASLRVDCAPELRRLSVVNCKTLQHIVGLRTLPYLESLRIGRTLMNLDEVLDHLPRNLKGLSLYGTKKDDVLIAEKLAKLNLPSAVRTGTP